MPRRPLPAAVTLLFVLAAPATGLSRGAVNGDGGADNDNGLDSVGMKARS